MSAGRPTDQVRDAWMQMLGLSYKVPKRSLPNRLLAQLSMCKSDEARRILLRKSELADPNEDQARERIGGDARDFLEQKPASRRSIA